MARAWVRHNIEEVGQLEFLLPGLAAADREMELRAAKCES